jgi:hypothetical protein
MALTLAASFAQDGTDVILMNDSTCTYTVHMYNIQYICICTYM